MSAYGAKYAQCPYYRSEAGRQICCEGYQEGMGLTVTFQDPTDYSMYRNGLCRSLRHFLECPVAQMLTKEFEENRFDDRRRK